MHTPVTVSFEGVPVSEGVRAACLDEARNLDRCSDRIISCHVTIALPTHRRQGGRWDIHVRIAVPGGEIVVSHLPAAPDNGERSELAVREAFDEVRRQLQDYVRRQRRTAAFLVSPERPPERGASCAVAEDGFRGLPDGERLYLHEPRTVAVRPPGDGEDWKGVPE